MPNASMLSDIDKIIIKLIITLTFLNNLFLNKHMPISHHCYLGKILFSLPTSYNKLGMSMATPYNKCANQGGIVYELA